MNTSAAHKRQEFETTVATEAFDGNSVVANNDPLPGHTTNQEIENVRSRIKAARLEHLMARQLETDLAIELTIAPQLEADILATMTETTDQCDAEIAVLEPYTREVEEHHFFEKTRSECASLVSTFQQQAAALENLVESSGGLLNFINRIEVEFRNADAAKIELNDTRLELENARVSNMEHASTIEKQTKQISVLEALRESMAHNFSDAKATITELKAKNTEAQQKLEDTQEEASRFLTIASHLETEKEQAEADLAKAEETIISLRTELKKRETELTATSSKVSAIKAKSATTQDEFAELKSKYEQLNIKSLENQGEHLSRISELEHAAKSLKIDLDATRREKEDLGSELDAVNKLLMLHGEMLDALSNHAADTSKK